MALGPGQAGKHHVPLAKQREGMLRFLEEMIDKQLEKHQPGEVFGIDLPKGSGYDAVMPTVVERYRTAGWSHVRVEPDEARGRYRLTLEP